MSTTAHGLTALAACVPSDIDLRDHRSDQRSAVFDALSDAAAIIEPDGTISDVNLAWSTFADLNLGEPGPTGCGASYLATCDRAAANGDVDAAAVADGLRGILGGRLRSFEHRYPCPSPIEDRWFVVRITPLAGGGGALVAHLDITASKLTEDRLSHRASHDPLTGLPNRDAVLDVVRAALARLDRGGPPVAILFLDLDGFKPVNDRYGHDAGDLFLIKVANRLQHQLRASDVVGRVGGDEFVAVCDAADAEALAGRIGKAVATPIQVGGDRVSVGVSVGVAIASSVVGTDLDDAARALLGEADMAMYAAKRARHQHGS